MNIVLPNALLFLLLPFMFFHVLAGWHYYASNMAMLASAAVFGVALVFVYYAQSQVQIQQGWGRFAREIERISRSPFVRGFGLAGLAWHSFVFVYLYFALGISAEELRIQKSSIISGFITLPMNAIALSGFTLVCIRLATRSKGRFSSINMDLLIIVATLIAVMANGTRALLAQYAWMLIIILFSFRVINIKQLIQLAFLGVLGLSSIKLLRYIFSESAGTLEYYRMNGAFDPNNIWWSIWNFIVIQLNDNPWRAFMTFEYVPERMLFQGGRSTFFDFVTLLPGHQFNPNVGLSWYVMNGPLVEREFPPTLIAQGWFDFGMAGAITYAIGYPLLLFVLWLACARRPSLTRLAIFSFFLFNLVIGLYGAPSWLFFSLFVATFFTMVQMTRIRIQ